MRTLKRFAALSLCVLLCFSMCGVAVFAEAPDTPDLTGGVVTALGYERYFSSIKPMRFFTGELDGLYEWMANVEQALDCFVSVGDEEYEATCKIEWNLSELTLDEVGEYLLIGTLIPPEGVAVSDVELCTVLGNLLENAVEACGRLSEGEKKITVTTQTAGELLVLMENSYDGKVLRKGKHFLSQKTEDGRIGIGLQSAREIVERCGGSFYVYPLEQTFRVGVVLPVRGSI